MHTSTKIIHCSSSKMDSSDQICTTGHSRSMTEQQRQHYFQILKRTSPKNSFILVGPPTSSFQGTLVAQFDPPKSLGIQSKTSNDAGVLPSQTAATSFQILQKGRDVRKPNSFQKHYQGMVSKNSSFQGSGGVVIDLLDTLQQASDGEPSVVKEQSKKHYPLPIFQFDRKQYTPTFALSGSELNLETLKNHFMSKIRDYRREISRQQLMQSRPKSKYLYCAICKEHYQEYLGHVSTKKHLDNYQRNKFTRNIVSLQLTLNTGIFRRQKEKEKEKNIKRKLLTESRTVTPQPAFTSPPPQTSSSSEESQENSLSQENSQKLMKLRLPKPNIKGDIPKQGRPRVTVEVTARAKGRSSKSQHKRGRRKINQQLSKRQKQSKIQQQSENSRENLMSRSRTKRGKRGKQRRLASEKSQSSKQSFSGND